MLKWLLIIFLIFIPTYAYSSDNDISRDNIRILLIHSNSKESLDTRLQRQGFINQIRRLDYNIIIRDIYLRSDIINIHDLNLPYVANQLPFMINRFSPDYIFISGDNALAWILTTDVVDNYNILVSGNTCDYKFKNNIVFSPNIINLDRLYAFFNNVRYIIAEWHLIWDGSAQSYCLLQNYKKEMNRFNSKYKIYEVSTVPDLRRVLRSMSDNLNTINVFFINRLYDPDIDRRTGGYLSKYNIIYDVVEYSHRLELFLGSDYCEAGISLCYGSDYYDMGKLLGSYLVNIISNDLEFTNKTLKPSVVLEVNRNRMFRLGLNRLLFDGLNYIDKIY